MADPIVDIRTELLGQTLGGVLLDTTNVRMGFRREADGTYVTSPCIFMREMQVGNKTPYFGGPTAPDLNTTFVQLLIPSDRNGYQAGRTLAYALIEFLHKRQVAGYIQWLSQSASPGQFEDDEGRPIFNFWLRCDWKE